MSQERNNIWLLLPARPFRRASHSLTIGRYTAWKAVRGVYV